MVKYLWRCNINFFEMTPSPLGTFLCLLCIAQVYIGMHPLLRLSRTPRVVQWKRIQVAFVINVLLSSASWPGLASKWGQYFPIIPELHNVKYFPIIPAMKSPTSCIWILRCTVRVRLMKLISFLIVLRVPDPNLCDPWFLNFGRSRILTQQFTKYYVAVSAECIFELFVSGFTSFYLGATNRLHYIMGQKSQIPRLKLTNWRRSGDLGGLLSAGLHKSSLPPVVGKTSSQNYPFQTI